MIGKKRMKFAILALAVLACAIPAQAQGRDTYASVGFMGISPNLTDTMADFQVDDMLYGGTVAFAVSPWFTLSADVLWLGDIYYGPGSGTITAGPSSWTSLVESGYASGAKADWTYFESLIYAPLSFNLTIPLGFVKPYIGAGPAFYFHFPSNVDDANFSAYLDDRYGAGARIKTGLTARAGLDIIIADSFSIGAGYIVREDIPALLFEHVGDTEFYLENGYAFVSAKVIMR
ncbi:MAG: outer membrane beta-barrel protein [Rectinemataceae bacterium]